MIILRLIWWLIGVSVSVQWIYWAALDVGSWFGLSSPAALTPSWHFFACGTAAAWMIDRNIAEFKKMKVKRP